VCINPVCVTTSRQVKCSRMAEGMKLPKTLMPSQAADAVYGIGLA
jgi:hypothetical protein